MIYKTIELAGENIGNMFDLILLASKRARDIQLNLTTPLLSDDCKDKPTLIALKEISKGLITNDYFDIKIIL